MKPIRIGILGLGTVGSATVNVLKQNAEEINRRAGRGIEIVSAAVANVRKKRNCDTGGIKIVKDPQQIINDDSIDIVIELIGGYGFTKDLILQAIAKGKHIVTANKALIALHGNEIFAAAHKKGVIVAFEAAVAGGIPIIKAIREGLAANKIIGVTGIINGTSNFILSEMSEKDSTFDATLKRAQKLGYAEADPSFDIDGIDIAHKLTILASIAFGIPLQYEKVYKQGISHITIDDIHYADEFGYCIKQLGIAWHTEQGIQLRVHPTLVRKKRLIANVHGVMNAVLVHGDRVGPTIFYGPGAGGDATASAVVADIVDIVRSMTVDPENRVPHLAFQTDAIVDIPIVPMSDVVCANYLRLIVEDRAGVMAEITTILAHLNISIEAMVQKEPLAGDRYVPIVLITHRASEKNMDLAVAQIEAAGSCQGKIVRLRLDQ